MSTHILDIQDGTFVAPNELTIHSVERLRDDLQVALGGVDRVVAIRMDNVGHIDTAALQLLLSARRTLAESNRELKLDQPSDACQQVIAALGLTDALLGHTE